MSTRTKVGDYSRRQGGHRSEVGHVGWHREGACTGLSALGGQGFQRFAITRSQHDGAALLRKSKEGGTAAATRSARGHRRLAQRPLPDVGRGQPMSDVGGSAANFAADKRNMGHSRNQVDL
jgi:hypothetical protein